MPRHLPAMFRRPLLVLLVVVAALIGGTTAAAARATAGSTPAFTGAHHANAFLAEGRRCGTIDRSERTLLAPLLAAAAPGDCSNALTNPDPAYGPGGLFEIDVVVHILMNATGTLGVISDAMVQSQIDVLDEDFLALAGSNGAPGNATGIRFVLATVDPDGNPTSGITRHYDNTWYGDGGAYWETLAWDPQRYLNIYTNTAAGNLGYVPFLPADFGGALAGSKADRVVIAWDVFGRNAPFGSPFDLGRTVTHEVGHYLGLEHTFNGGCADPTPPGCYTSGDLVCDTNSEAAPVFSPCALGDSVTCSSVDPSDNYMDYSDDLCMNRFTVEQLRRMRCSLLHYRPAVYREMDILRDGFESGDTSGWSPPAP